MEHDDGPADPDEPADHRDEPTDRDEAADRDEPGQHRDGKGRRRRERERRRRERERRRRERRKEDRRDDDSDPVGDALDTVETVSALGEGCGRFAGGRGGGGHGCSGRGGRGDIGCGSGGRSGSGRSSCDGCDGPCDFTLLRLSTALLVAAALVPDRPVGQRLVRALVRGYQRTLTRFAPACPSTPNCSAYALAAIDALGARRGLVAAAERIRRCGTA